MSMTARMTLTISRDGNQLVSYQTEIDPDTAHQLIERITTLLTAQSGRVRLVRQHKIGGGLIIDLTVLPPPSRFIFLSTRNIQ